MPAPSSQREIDVAGISLRRASAAFWVIAGLSLLWNAFGAYDFVMTGIRDPVYCARLPVAVIDYVDEMPIWAILAWAIGVWAALAGALLLLRRSRLAVLAFALSLIGLAANTAQQAIHGLPPEMTTPAMLGMSVTIWIAAVFLLWFAWRSWRGGVLR